MKYRKSSANEKLLDEAIRDMECFRIRNGIVSCCNLCVYYDMQKGCECPL